jgi:hypothetical protein
MARHVMLLQNNHFFLKDFSTPVGVGGNVPEPVDAIDVATSNIASLSLGAR